MSTSIYDIPVTRLNGDPASLKDYANKVLLVVNTASQCGLTPQYDGLETLYQKYAGQGLVVLGFPSNQFGAQEPGSAEQIATFCSTNYSVTFPLFAKTDVNGPNAHPLYVWLKQNTPGDGAEDIGWNFAKFLVGRDGKVIARYAPTVVPSALGATIEEALKA
ncbi:MAG: glutathione peroxidase [Rhodocyclaceae bacterium]|nr:glutathione peroxidase [Rhodocyclaceae bacterium]